MNFWQKLPKPFFVLTPMANVTDSAFRAVIAQYGAPHVFWTEFVSADGLCSPGREVLIKDLRFGENEKPIVAQLFSSRPEKMREASKLVAEMGFSGIDINMGCPDRSIEKQDCGAAMIKNPENARAIIRAVKEGIRDAGVSIPVSVKTRIGYNTNQIDTWIPVLLEEGIDALTVHCRTRKEMSLVPARWEHIREVVALRDKIAPSTVIIGNGDVKDIADARTKILEYGADGAMFGRAIFGNPWLFSGIGGATHVPTLKEKLIALREHIMLFDEHLGGVKSFAVMKKHFKSYVSGFDHAKDVRISLMEAESAKDACKIIDEFLLSI